MSFDRAFLEELKRAARLSDIVGQFVALQRRGREHVGLCPFHKERSGSFTVADGKGFCHCFGCGWHGGAIDFLKDYENLDFPAAVERLADLVGMDVRTGERRAAVKGERRSPTPEQSEAVSERAAAEAREAQRRRDAARLIYAGAVPWPGTLVEAYLRARGLDVDLLADALGGLRFDAACWHGEARCLMPAMIAPVQDVDGRITGVHRTYLAPGGHGKASVQKAKLMLGDCWGGAIRFGTPVERLGMGEGVETSLSVLQALWRAGDRSLPVWAAGSLGNLAGRGRGRGAPHPTRPDKRLPSPRACDPWDRVGAGLLLPAQVRELLWFADGDGDAPTGDALLRRAADKFARRRVRFRVARPAEGTDFNDMLTGAAPELARDPEPV